MKKLFMVCTLSLMLVPFVSHARDSIGDYSIKDAMELDQAKSKLGDDIKFYFGDQTHGKIKNSFGEFSTNKKTNAFNKSDLQACQWAFISAMMALKKRAIREGGNAVVNIKSNYRNNLKSSKDTFQCGNGTFVAGVAFVGTVVKLN